ncbi:MAG: hypothetical protein AB1442_09625, partial [Nitrospirota bacterium]
CDMLNSFPLRRIHRAEQHLVPHRNSSVTLCKRERFVKNIPRPAGLGSDYSETPMRRADAALERLYHDSYRDTSEVVSTENER